MEDVNIGSTTEESVPGNTGETDRVGETTSDTGETDEQSVPESQETGSSEEESGESSETTEESSEKGKYGEFGNDPDKVYEGYKNLEQKLGNWKDVEKRSQLLDQVLQKPEVQKALGLMKEDVQAENPEMDFSEMPPEKVIEHFVDRELDKRFKERIDPIAQDFYSQKAERALQNVREKFPDFDEYKADVGKYLEDHPTLVGDEKTLTDIYKIVSYDKARSQGEQQAIEKQRKKKEISIGTSRAPGNTSQKKAGSIMEAYRMAKGEL